MNSMIHVFQDGVKHFDDKLRLSIWACHVSLFRWGWFQIRTCMLGFHSYAMSGTATICWYTRTARSIAPVRQKYRACLPTQLSLLTTKVPMAF